MKYLSAAVMLLACSAALAEDMTPKVAAHLRPENAEIKISKIRTATEEGRSVQVACGVVTVRKDAGNFSTRTFAYVVEDDKLWLTGMEEWLKEPQEMGVVRVMKYCPGN